MIPSREIFWNIQYGELLYLIGTVVIGIFIYAIYRRYKFWRLGRPANRFNHLCKRTWAFIVTAVVDGLFHRKFFGVAPSLDHRRLSSGDLLPEAARGRGRGFPSFKDFIPREFYPREFYPGIAHLLVFGGCGILLLGAFMDFISHYFFHFMHGNFYLVYSIVVDAFGILVLIGVSLFVVRRYIQKPDRLDNTVDDLVALSLISLVVVTGFFVEGFRIAATELKTTPAWAAWSPGGFILAQAFSGLSQDTLLTWHRIIWWLHMLIGFGAIAYVSLYWNRLWHILISPLNVFFKSLEPRGALVPIDLETAETFGVSKVEDFTWKQLMDLDACTRCGRCQDICPAYNSGKPLSPKKMTQDIRANWLERAPALLGAGGKEGDAGNGGRALIGDSVTEDEIWDCTTCRACQEVCPVGVEHVDKIIDMRRSLVLEGASLPETGEGALRSIESRGHPWRGTTLTRTDWTEGLDVKILAEDSDVDVLFWVGCTEALEERSTKIAQAVAKVLKLAGVNFGILGVEESCCGDPARRLGNEYLFQIQAQKNIELLKGYNVKKVVTACPHCFNMLKNEYPQFGGEFEVIHHTEFIADLMEEDKLRIIKGSSGVITYHDSCYLGRYNAIYEPPRRILNSLPDVDLVEMERCLERGFCCGAGGGHLWLEEQRTGQRISEMRTEQARAVQAQLIATACPYCLQMFEDAIKAMAAEESLRVLDIAEMVAESAAYRPSSK